ncbi:MAG: hypothetical protein H9535_19320 [Ignavibacteria bacterium]|nr:hypothetical protein [Ignavibacteria bacterium]
MTVGEIVLPKSVVKNLDPKVLAQAFKAAKLDQDRYTVGGNDDSFNPATGLREYFEGSSGADSHGSNSDGTSGTGGNDGGYGGGGSSGGDAGPGSIGHDSMGEGTPDSPAVDTGPSVGPGAIGNDSLGEGTPDSPSPVGPGPVGFDSIGEGFVDTTPTPSNAPVTNTLSIGTDPFEAMQGPPGPPAMPTYGETAGAMGRAGDRVAAHFQDMAARPAETAINTAFGLLAGPLGLVNSLSGIFGGPTVGSVALGAVNSLGVSTPGIGTGTQNNNIGFADGNSGSDSPASTAQAVEAATGQVATTINGSDTVGQGTITREVTNRRRAFSRLSLGQSARTTASVLW